MDTTTEGWWHVQDEIIRYTWHLICEQIGVFGFVIYKQNNIYNIEVTFNVHLCDSAKSSNKASMKNYQVRK